MEQGLAAYPSLGEIAIDAKGLTKQFGQTVAVNGLTLNVRRGEVVTLLGPNGAGKTTTVRMLAALLRPSAGRATVAGLDTVQDAQQVRRIVGLLTEFPGLYKRMRPVEYLEFYGQLQGLSRSTRRERIEQLLHQFELWDARGLQLGHFSKGMAQKLALIRAILHDPDVLFLDEPTSAMDPHSARLVRDTIARLKARGKSIIICTHNLSEARELADRIAIIRAGAIVVMGTLDQLQSLERRGTLCELRLASSWNGLREIMSPFVEIISSGEDWLRYRTADYEQMNPVVLNTLTRAGAKVVSLNVIPNSLEDIYLSLIEKLETGSPDEAGNKPGERSV